jgi:hypothetical protein
MPSRPLKPVSKHSGGHQAPRTEAEKRRAAKRRRERLLAPVQVVHAAPAPPPVCGFRWRNKGRRRRCCLPVHDIVEVAHFDRQSHANAWDPRRDAEMLRRAAQTQSPGDASSLRGADYESKKQQSTVEELVRQYDDAVKQVANEQSAQGAAEGARS